MCAYHSPTGGGITRRRHQASHQRAPFHVPKEELMVQRRESQYKFNPILQISHIISKHAPKSVLAQRALVHASMLAQQTGINHPGRIGEFALDYAQLPANQQINRNVLQPRLPDITVTQEQMRVMRESARRLREAGVTTVNDEDNEEGAEEPPGDATIPIENPFEPEDADTEAAPQAGTELSDSGTSFNDEDAANYWSGSEDATAAMGSPAPSLSGETTPKPEEEDATDEPLPQPPSPAALTQLHEDNAARAATPTPPPPSPPPAEPAAGDSDEPAPPPLGEATTAEAADDSEFPAVPVHLHHFPEGSENFDDLPAPPPPPAPAAPPGSDTAAPATTTTPTPPEAVEGSPTAPPAPPPAPPAPPAPPPTTVSLPTSVFTNPIAAAPTVTNGALVKPSASSLAEAAERLKPPTARENAPPPKSMDEYMARLPNDFELKARSSQLKSVADRGPKLALPERESEPNRPTANTLAEGRKRLNKVEPPTERKLNGSTSAAAPATGLLGALQSKVSAIHKANASDDEKSDDDDWSVASGEGFGDGNGPDLQDPPDSMRPTTSPTPPDVAEPTQTAQPKYDTQRFQTTFTTTFTPFTQAGRFVSNTPGQVLNATMRQKRGVADALAQAGGARPVAMGRPGEAKRYKVDGNLLPPSNVPIPQVGAMMTDILQDEVKHLASDTFSTGAQPMESTGEQVSLMDSEGAGFTNLSSYTKEIKSGDARAFPDFVLELTNSDGPLKLPPKQLQGTESDLLYATTFLMIIALKTAVQGKSHVSGSMVQKYTTKVAALAHRLGRKASNGILNSRAKLYKIMLKHLRDGGSRSILEHEGRTQFLAKVLNLNESPHSPNDKKILHNLMNTLRIPFDVSHSIMTAATNKVHVSGKEQFQNYLLHARGGIDLRDWARGMEALPKPWLTKAATPAAASPATPPAAPPTTPPTGGAMWDNPRYKAMTSDIDRMAAEKKAKGGSARRKRR